jgi:hypothetical protein
MDMKKKLALSVACLLAVGALSSAHAAPKTVWKDPAGDVDAGGAGPNPATDQSGFDLVSGSIDRKGANLVFTVKHAVMPPIGAVPEAFRFIWGFSAGAKSYRVTTKRFEVGKPNPATQEDTDQVGKTYVDGLFRLEGNCGATDVGGTQMINCHTLGYLKGVWNPAKATFSYSVPLKMIKAKPGTKIGPPSGDAAGICPICWVSHIAERSLSPNTVVDGAAQTGFYKVPR